MTTAKDKSEAVSQIGRNCYSVRLRLLNRAINAVYDRALAPHGIRVSQVNILIAVAFSQNATSRGICRALQMDKSTFSRTLARLVSNNWLATEPSGEGKILNIAVTGEGLRKIDEIHGAWQEAQKEAAKMLGEQASEAILKTGSRFLLK